MKQWHHADKFNRMYCNLEDGKKISMPRYYKDKLYSEIDRKVIGAVTRQRMIEEENEKIAAGGEMYFRDLAEAHIAAFERLKTQADTNNKI